MLVEDQAEYSVWHEECHPLLPCYSSPRPDIMAAENGREALELLEGTGSGYHHYEISHAGGRRYTEAGPPDS